MTRPTRIFYFYLLSITGILLLTESSLEFRHYKLGYTTPIFGTQQKNTSANHFELENTPPVENVPSTSFATGNSVTYGPTNNFPFKSRVIDDIKNGAKRIWIASASHAEGGRLDAKDIFPNLISQSLHHEYSCEVINGSKAGMTIQANISQLNKYAPRFQPDYVILYQMSMEIARQQRLLSQTHNNNSSTNNGIIDFSGLIKPLQSLSLYVHLSSYIGGSIKLSGPLKNSLPSEMDEDFTKQIFLFIEACKKNHTKPILMTFVTSHNENNIREMSFSQRITMLRYNDYLSPEGWINMVSRYNRIIRDIAFKEHIPLIDLQQEMSGQSRYYLDFYHFNKTGHKKIAALIGKNLVDIIAK